MPRHDHDFGTSLEDDDPLLYHVTPDANLPGILRDGLRAGSCWGTGDMADYYAGVIADEGDRPVQLAIRLSDLQRLCASAGVDLQPDQGSIDEPITTALEMDEDEVWEAWEESDGDWKASLEIGGALKMPAAIAAHELLADRNGDLQRLDETDPDPSP